MLKTKCIHYERIEKEGDHFRGRCIKCKAERVYPSIAEIEDMFERKKGRLWKHTQLILED